jgi:hypothetical protein
MSKHAFDKITNVTTHKVNKKIKAIVNNIGVFHITLPPHIVAIQLKNFITVGIAIIIVADAK